MLFSAKDIFKILSCVDFAMAKLTVETLGMDYLTESEIDLLKERGLNLSDPTPTFPKFYQAFLFGRLQAVLTPKQLNPITYTDFLNFIPHMSYFAPNNRELEYYSVAANKMQSYIKGFGDKIKDDVRASISAEEVSYLSLTKGYDFSKRFQKVIVKKITSNIAKQMRDWGVNWAKIVATECQDVYNMGTAQCIVDEDMEARVYFDVYPGACRHCIRLYTTDGIGSQPRIFNIQRLLANGTNYGVHSKNWVPTIHPVHPFCRCNLRKLPDGYKWDCDLHQFVKSTDKELSNNKSTLTIGKKEYKV